MAFCIPDIAKNAYFGIRVYLLLYSMNYDGIVYREMVLFCEGDLASDMKGKYSVTFICMCLF